MAGVPNELIVQDCFSCPLRTLEGLCAPNEAQTRSIQAMKQGERALERGQTLYTQGARSGEMYTVLEGVLIRYRTLDDGRRQIVNFMFPGMLLGLQAAFDEPCGHSVEAIISSRVCVFDRADFQPLISEHPRLGFDVVWMAAKEETELEQHMVSLGKRNARERVAALAVWLLQRAIETGIAQGGNRVAIPLTQVQIADVTGLSVVHANRTLQSLRRDGIVDWKPNLLIVPDLARAMDFADADATGSRKNPFI